MYIIKTNNRQILEHNRHRSSAYRRQNIDSKVVCSAQYCTLDCTEYL